MTKKFTTSDKLVRRPFEAPTQIAQLLKAAGVETRAPEEVGGMLFGCLAHLFTGVYSQFPEHWPTFRGAFIEAADDMRDVLTSDDPPRTVRLIMERQKRDRAAMERSS